MNAEPRLVSVTMTVYREVGEKEDPAKVASDAAKELKRFAKTMKKAVSASITGGQVDADHFRIGGAS